MLGVVFLATGVVFGVGEAAGCPRDFLGLELGLGLGLALGLGLDVALGFGRGFALGLGTAFGVRLVSGVAVGFDGLGLGERETAPLSFLIALSGGGV